MVSVYVEDGGKNLFLGSLSKWSTGFDSSNLFICLPNPSLPPCLDNRLKLERDVFLCF